MKKHDIPTPIRQMYRAGDLRDYQRMKLLVLESRLKRMYCWKPCTSSCHSCNWESGCYLQADVTF